MGNNKSSDPTGILTISYQSRGVLILGVSALRLSLLLGYALLGASLLASLT